ncbi:TLD-domain-containing protein [Hyaloscypha bicolor E]|uniref:Oxidation resistance protein 1 n=1 Tax=Hyaloscypha bicolor E TaxID=1095630 RepID=A0A2J6TVT2_9HELO|nr:TLD-domain-containing protein [Hyaloscypha bicolor E]PMD67115.1 TLD-domain-containing protein [Hyaloscypha bicolor E]
MSNRNYFHETPSASSSGSRNASRNTSPPPTLSASWSVPATVSHAAGALGGLLRRFSTDPPKSNSDNNSPGFPPSKVNDGTNGVYTPPYRTASPFQPPPLYPVSLKGWNESTPESARLLTRALAEEIRLLVPARLQLCEDWNLVYSLEENGVSLGTLYKKCDDLRGLRNGFVLIVRDGEGGLFGAYLTDAPHPSAHYFGTGECFLWRASILSPQTMANHLPPPPSTDTTHLQRSTTIGSSVSSLPQTSQTSSTLLSPTHQPSFTTIPSPTHSTSSLAPPSPSFQSGASTPERIRFKAFPYSGVNDYLMLCDHSFLSVGGGDGHYGLWLDDTFEKGVSSHCLTFGNEPLSEEGGKFWVVGVELWSIGNS